MRRLIAIVVLLTPLALTACGSDERTVVVTPQPNATVVVPPSGNVRVCPAGTTC